MPLPSLADISLPEPLTALLRTVAEEADRRGLETALVGGALRDLLLGREPLDLDVAVAGDGTAVQDLAGALAQRLGGRPEGHPSFGTASLPLRLAGCPARLDLAMRRRESYPRPGALPRVTPGSWAEDLQRRDFTINAVRWPLRLPPEAGGSVRPASLRPHARGAVIRTADLVTAPGALDDLSRGLIRVLHPISFVDDPTRIFRAVRLAVRLGFTLEPETRALAVQAVAGSALSTLSPARLAQEVRLTAEEADASQAFVLLDELGVRQSLLPGWPGPERDSTGAGPTDAARPH